MLLLLALMAWAPVSAADIHEGTPGSATRATVTVQATPTDDATVTALNNEKLEDALSLKDTNLHGAIGLTKEQRAFCQAKGAIVDEDLTTSSSQSTIAPPAQAQSNDAQAPSAQSS